MRNLDYVRYGNNVPLQTLIGRRIASIEGLEAGSESVVIKCEDGTEFAFAHQQDCCESVDLHEFDGTAGGLITAVEESTNNDNKPSEYTDSHTWTFYSLHTERGTLHMRWLGESNGYYGEEVDLYVKDITP